MIVGKNGVMIKSKDYDIDFLILDHYDAFEFRLSLFCGNVEKALLNIDMESAIKLRDFLIERTTKDSIK